MEIINKSMFRVFAFVATLTLSISAWSYSPGKTYRITVLHTNDHHGAFWKNGNNEYGMAARATLVEKIRREVKSENGFVLLLDGGDVNTGTPESEMSDAEPDFRGMSFMKYDAMAVGNHEFDKPFSILLKQQKEWANFPFLSANIYVKKTGKRMFDPYKNLVLGDLKVTLLGLTTEQTPDQSIRFPHDELEVKAAVEEAGKIVPQLRGSTDILIAITHIGHYPNENHGSRTPGDVTLAREVNGIDLIVGGHTQLPLFNTDFQNGTHIVQAGEWGKHLGRVDLEFKNGKVTLVKYQLIPINLKENSGDKESETIEESSLLLDILKPFKKSAEGITSEVVGKLDGKFDGHRSVIRVKETNLGNFVTYLMAENTGADIALNNSGVIRSGFEPGVITYGDILTVHPIAFGLKYATLELTGRELFNYLSDVSIKTSGAFPQYYGIKVYIKNDKLFKVEIRKRGEANFTQLNFDQKYKLAIQDFIAGGGDGYPVINQHPTYITTEIVDAEATKAYFKKHSPVRADDFAPIGNLVRIDE